MAASCLASLKLMVESSQLAAICGFESEYKALITYL